MYHLKRLKMRNIVTSSFLDLAVPAEGFTTAQHGKAFGRRPWSPWWTDSTLFPSMPLPRPPPTTTFPYFVSLRYFWWRASSHRRAGQRAARIFVKVLDVSRFCEAGHCTRRTHAMLAFAPALRISVDAIALLFHRRLRRPAGIAIHGRCRRRSLLFLLRSATRARPSLCHHPGARLDHRQLPNPSTVL